MANRRAATKASPSSGSSVEYTSVAPCSVNTRAMYSVSSTPAGPRSSDAATIIAAALRSRPIFSLSSTALMATESMNSSIDGRILPVIATTASAAAATESNDATTVQPLCCGGSSRNVTSVITPRVPSLPDEQLGQAQSRNVFQARATEAHRGAVGEDHLHAKHVIGCDAVLHAAQAARVGRDVAADAADLV